MSREKFQKVVDIARECDFVDSSGDNGETVAAILWASRVIEAAEEMAMDHHEFNKPLGEPIGCWCNLCKALRGKE